MKKTSAKGINEKTFELNITGELLDLSKSFVWYLSSLSRLNIPKLQNEELIREFLNQGSLFAEGLTQEQESDPNSGGYDVSIRLNSNLGQECRLMFLQFKAGIKVKRSNLKSSKFSKKVADIEKRSTEHILFKFNDAAGHTQHSTLRSLANSVNIVPSSVMYVFPRITEKADFLNKIGKLTTNTSFVPVLELDRQAGEQSPQVFINDGVVHKFRTSYDGKTSEVNLLLLFLHYDFATLSNILAEMICIQIERLAKLVLSKRGEGIIDFINTLRISFSEKSRDVFLDYSFVSEMESAISSYLDRLSESLGRSLFITSAPSVYSTIVPKDGLRIDFERGRDYSSIHYQIF